MRRIISRIIVAHPVSAQEAPGEAIDRVEAGIAAAVRKPRGEAPAKRGEVVARPAPKPTAAELAERERERKERGEGAGEGAVESIGAGARRWQQSKAKPCGCDAFPGVECPEHAASGELCGCGGYPGDPRPGQVCAKHASYWPR